MLLLAVAAGCCSILQRDWEHNKLEEGLVFEVVRKAIRTTQMERGTQIAMQMLVGSYAIGERLRKYGTHAAYPSCPICLTSEDTLGTESGSAKQ